MESAFRSRQSDQCRNAAPERSPIRDSAYDSVVIVVLDQNFQVVESLKLAKEAVEELFPHRDYVKWASHHYHGGPACRSSRREARPSRSSGPPRYVTAHDRFGISSDRDAAIPLATVRSAALPVSLGYPATGWFAVVRYAPIRASSANWGPAASRIPVVGRGPAST
jgi:hypothetical protein